MIRCHKKRGENGDRGKRKVVVGGNKLKGKGNKGGRRKEKGKKEKKRMTKGGGECRLGIELRPQHWKI